MADKKLTRRDFLKAGGAAVAGAASVMISSRVEAADRRASRRAFKEEPYSKGDIISRMENDVKRAMNKPLKERHWGMVLDTLKCVGCDGCTIACKSENVTPPGVAYTVVMKEEVGTYPTVRRQFTPKICNQCQKAPCVSVCPVKATHTREDGVTIVEYKKCIGCKYCLNACPYDARFSDKGDFYTDNTPKVEDYEKRPTYELGKRWPRKKGASPIGNARKCHFCLHRLEKGLLPACVVSCMGRARMFGDLNDTKSLVSELIVKHKASRSKEELGTEPSVYYIG